MNFSLQNKWTALKPYYELSIRTRLMHWIIAFLGSILVGCILVFGVLGNVLEDSRVKVAQLDGKLKKIDMISSGVSNMDVIIGQLRDELAGHQQKTLRPQKQAEVISFISQTTEGLEIQINNISPATKTKQQLDNEKGKTITQALFELDILCSYRTLGQFFYALKKAPLILTVEQFDADRADQNSNLLHVYMIISAYVEPVTA